MSSLSEFHQSSFLPSTSKKKRPSKQCELMRLPFARVPLPPNEDEDDKEKTPGGSSVASRALPGTPPSASTGPSAPTQHTVGTLLLTENDWSLCGPGGAEHVSSVPAPPKEPHLDRRSQRAVVSEMTSGLCSSDEREKLSLSNVTARKKRGLCWASEDLPVDAPSAAASGPQQSLSPASGRNMETEGCATAAATEKSITVPRNPPGLAGLKSPPAPSRKPGTDSAGHMQEGEDPQEQATVYGADMELTATDVSTIVTVTRGGRPKSNKKMNDCEGKASRKARDQSSEAKREGPQRKCKLSAGMHAEGQAESGPQGRSACSGCSGDSGDPDFIVSTAQPSPSNLRRKTTLHRGSGAEGRHSAQCSRQEKGCEASTQGTASPPSPSAGGALREGGMRKPQNSKAGSRSKASRQTCVIRKIEKDPLFSNRDDKETISENLEVAQEFQAADLSSKENENVYAYEIQNLLNKRVSDRQPASQSEVKLKQKVSRRTEIISQVNQWCEDNSKHVHTPQQRNGFFHVDKETASGNLGVSEDLHRPSPFLSNHGGLCARETWNSFNLQKPIIPAYPVQQNESKINKFRQKVNRKTEIISETNHFDDNKSGSCSEKGNLLFPQKEKEVLAADAKDLSEFQAPGLPPQDSELCKCEAETASTVRKQICGVLAACRNDPNTGRLGGKSYQSTEISELTQGHGLQALEKSNVASLIHKDAEPISKSPEVTLEFHTVDFPTKDHENLYNYETQKNCVTSVQLPQQKESKTNKLRQKVNRKTEIISKVIQIYEDIDNEVHGQKNYSEDLDLKIVRSKRRFDQKTLIGEYYMEINSDIAPDPSKLVKKHRRKSSGKAKNILTRDHSRLALPPADSSQAPATSEAGMACVSSGPDSATGGPVAHPGLQRPVSVTPDTNSHASWVEAKKAGQCQATEVTRVIPRVNRRTTSTALPRRSKGAAALVPSAAPRRPAGCEHVDQENWGESGRSFGSELDFYTKAFQSFSQIHSPDMQCSSSDGVHEGSVPVSVSSSKFLAIRDLSVPTQSLSCRGCSDEHEKMKEVRASVGQRAQKKPATGDRTLQDLTNTDFFSSNTAKSESESREGASQPPSKRRRCTPVSLKEPSLKRKMRR
ncbi:shugoshin 2 isoform X2 [Octodon degus]|nr:shugoshin 2 isoform X2 [Octodon degus]